MMSARSSRLSPKRSPPSPIGARSRRLYYWCHTTSHQQFETGIQRVTRRLARALGQEGVDIVGVGRDDRTNLVEVIGRGPAAFDMMMAAEAGRPMLLVPEIALGVDPVRLGRAYGMCTVVLVHDLIPLKLRTHYDPETVKVYEAYYASFASADAVLATTRCVADDLLDYLAGKGLRVPPIYVVPLPAQFGDLPRVRNGKPARVAGEPLRLVTVASWEPRKNLPRVLKALARAQCTVPIALTLIGRRGMFPAHDQEVEAALAKASDVNACGTLPDEAVAHLIADCNATVYSSWEEGFGLPIGESLWLGRPCLCHNGSSMAEVAPGGGTLMIDMTDEAAITEALVELARGPDLLARLSAEAVNRPLTSWSTYANEVVAKLDPGFQAGMP